MIVIKVTYLCSLQTHFKALLVKWIIVSVQLLPVNRIHLIQCVLNLLILLSAHIRRSLTMVLLLIRPWRQFQVEIHSRSKLVNIYCVFGRLVEIWYVGRPSYKAIIILILRHGTIWNICVVELRLVLIAALCSIVRNISYLVWSDGWCNDWLVLEWALNFVRWASDHSRRCLRLSRCRRLRRLL